MGETCTHPFHAHSDAAKRVSDACMLAWTFHGYDCVGKFMAFKAEDGSSDNEIYPRMKDAERHNPCTSHFYIAMHPGGIGECEAEILLIFYRGALRRGFRQSDPDITGKAKSPIPRISRENIAAQIAALLRK